MVSLTRRTAAGIAITLALAPAAFLPALGQSRLGGPLPPRPSAEEMAKALDTPVSTEHCQVLWNIMKKAATAAPGGRLFVPSTGDTISRTTTEALGNLFVTTVDGRRQVNCGGARIIPTETDTDFVFVLSVRDIADMTAGIEYGKRYGIIPEIPARRAPEIGSKDIRPAPKG